MKWVQDFITAFQFLTRFQFIRQSQWDPDSFGRSVKFFPLVGGMIGVLLLGLAAGAQYVWGAGRPAHLLAAGLIAAEIVITGGMHCDGFMDTMDGVFSGRSRERMLEIMKDSRVGAFGVVGFFLLLLLKYSLLLDIRPELLPMALIAMPVASRACVVFAVAAYPYARAEGLGKMFSDHSGRTTMVIGGLLAAGLLWAVGTTALTAGAAALAATTAFARYVTGKLGGLTGDVYGAVNELAAVVVLLVFAV